MFIAITLFLAQLSKKVTPPSHVVKPLTAYSRGRVLGLNEKYYQIGDYAVIREGREMKSSASASSLDFSSHKKAQNNFMGRGG